MEKSWRSTLSNVEFNTFQSMIRRKSELEDRCSRLILVLLEDPLSQSTGKARKLLLLVSAISFLFTIGNLFPNKIDALGIDILIEDRVFIIWIMLILLIYFLLSFNFYSYGDYTLWENKRSQLKNCIEELNKIKRQIRGFKFTEISMEKNLLASTREYKKLMEDTKEAVTDKLMKPRELIFSKYPRESYFLALRIFWEFGLPDFIAIVALILLIIR